MHQKQPNVLVILADQWSARIADGSGDYANGLQTPGLTRLASEGIRFEQSYSSFPLCTPARASLFTGLMPHNHHVIRNEETYADREQTLPMRKDVPTLGRIFKEAGYATAYFGKEHAGGYAWDGIDTFGSMKYSAGGMLAEGSAFDPVFTRDAIEFIYQDHDRPFYMTLSLINPHDICKVLGGKVKGATFSDAIFFCRNPDEPYLRFQGRPELPTNFSDPYVMGMIRDRDYMYEELAELTKDDWRRYIAAYHLLIENADWHIALVLEALEHAGLAEDTLVVFTTDHGDMMGSHGLISKLTFYEDSVKTLMLLRYPGRIAPGDVDNTSLIGSVDMLPTILDFCEVEVPDGLDGESFKARCLGEPAGDFLQLVSATYDGYMLRFGDYKYVRSKVYGEEYEILFDLVNDPDETSNIFMKPGHEKASAETRRLLEAWLQRENLSL